MANPTSDDFWVRGNKTAEKVLRDMGIATMVTLPAWHDVKYGVLRRARAALVDRPGPNGDLQVNGHAIAWAPANGVNLGGQYQGLDTIKVGARLYIKVYSGTDIGTAPGKCPLPDFHLRVLQDLVVISLHATGQRLLQSIEQAAGTGRILIKYCDGLTSTSQVDGIAGFDPGRLAPFDGNPRSADRNVYVQYNPALAGLPIMVGLDDRAYDRGNWGHPAEKPTDVTLFHELVHADDCMNGVFDAGVVQRGRVTVKLSEVRCVGLDEFKTCPYSENAYRTEGGLAVRGYYSDEPNETAAPLAPIVPAQSFIELLRWLGGHVPRYEESTPEQVIPRLKDTSMLKLATFKTITNAWGRRNKVSPVDTALRDLDRRVQGLLAADPDGKLEAITGMSLGSIRDDLKKIIDTCVTYENLASRQTSDRMPGVRSMKQAALRAFALYSIGAGDVRPHAAYFAMLPNVRVRDVDGNAQIGLAIEKQRDAANLTWLVQQGIDPNARHRGLRPVDIARREGRIIPEQTLAGHRGLKSDIPDVVTLNGTDYVGCLADGTYVDPAFGMNARTIYQHLWDSNGGAFRPILKLAALSMSLGPRLTAVAAGVNANIPLRVFLSGGGKSACHASNNVVSVIRYTTDTATEGGLIHELTHFVNHLVFTHEIMPFANTGGGADGTDYVQAIAKDAQRAGFDSLKAALTPFLPVPATAEDATTRGIVRRLPQAMNADGVNGPNLDKLVFTLFNRLNTYLVGTLYRGVPMPILQEAIVSIPQALHAYGDRNDALAHAPELLGYFERTYMPALQTAVNARELARARPPQVRPRRMSFGSTLPEDAPVLGRSRARSLT